MSEPEESTLPRIGVRDRHNSGGYTGANVTPNDSPRMASCPRSILSGGHGARRTCLSPS
jgi:hypothetical protein